MSFDTVLVANRGAIATRIIRTLRRMGLRSVAVYSEADAGSLHVVRGRRARLHRPRPCGGKLSRTFAAILAAAKESGAGAIHPGYGFLAENTEFAEACAAAGIVFVGPTPDNIRIFGLKHSARALAEEHDVPLAPGTGLLTDEAEAVEAAREIGFPVMLKATAGGGGIGMRICEDEAAVRDGFAAVARLGAGNFGDAGVFLERYIGRARHIEVQIFGDGARPHHAAGRARLFAAAPQPEGGRGSPRPSPLRRQARRADRGGRAAWRSGALPAPRARSNSCSMPSARNSSSSR